MHSC